MEYIEVYKQTLKIYDPGGVKMKLKAILAMATDVDEFAKMLLSKYCAQGTTVDVSHLEQGTAINESSYDDAFNCIEIKQINIVPCGFVGYGYSHGTQFSVKSFFFVKVISIYSSSDAFGYRIKNSNVIA